MTSFELDSEKRCDVELSGNVMLNFMFSNKKIGLFAALKGVQRSLTSAELELDSYKQT